MSTDTPGRNPLADYFKHPEGMVVVDRPRDLSAEPGFFRFGEGIGFGRLSGARPAPRAHRHLPDLSAAAVAAGGNLTLPFDFGEVIGNLRQERYHEHTRSPARAALAEAARRAYYYIRPVLDVPVRKHLQRLRLRGWQRIPFPAWPVDASVDGLMRSTLARAAASRALPGVPFIWFWPDGAPACAMMTHDVEGPAGLRFCRELADLDAAFDIPSAFQLVPDGPAEQTTAVRRMLQARGFEVNIHDLNHDGHLFSSKRRFLERAARINAYRRQFGCEGFRSAAMYREQDWYEALEFAYDMSVPNAAHLEPQRGGCCTVMPYFIGDLLELPLTTTQDYSLFHIIGDYSTRLWEEQSEAILAQHGLISFITHPDYLLEPRALAVYKELLGSLSRLRERGVWIAPPAAVNRWWRQRNALSLVPHDGGWQVRGPGSERARIAYAVVRDGELTYTFEPVATAGIRQPTPAS